MKSIPLVLALAASAFSADVPRPSGEFSIHMPNGSQTLLSSYRGDVVVMGFFFTTCVHCQNVSQILTRIQKDYAGKNVQVLAGCFNDNAANLVANFDQQFVHGAYPVGWDDRLAVLEFLKLPPNAPFFVPILVFVDRKGMIRSQYIGDENYLKDPDKSIRASIDELLKAPVSRSAISRKTK